MKHTYIPTAPTPTQIACNAIRDMFFSKQYNGVIPTKDIDVVKSSTQWHKAYGKKAVQQSIKELEEEMYMSLDEKGENWLWGGVMHETLFAKD